MRLSPLLPIFFLKAVTQTLTIALTPSATVTARLLPLSSHPTVSDSSICIAFSCKDGVFRKYQGARTKDDFLGFVQDQKWKSIEPVSSWFGPSSFLWVPAFLVSLQWLSQLNISGLLVKIKRPSLMLFVGLAISSLRFKRLRWIANRGFLRCSTEWTQCRRCLNSPCSSGWVIYLIFFTSGLCVFNKPSWIVAFHVFSSVATTTWRTSLGSPSGARMSSSAWSRCSPVWR